MGRPADVRRPGPLSRYRSSLSPSALTIAVAGVLFLLAYDGGTYGETNRDSLAIGVWWVTILGVALGLWPLARLTRASFLAGGLLAAFAGLTLASTIWADSAEGAYAEFNRATLYLGIFMLVTLAARRSLLTRWCDGLALGITATAVLALASRFFPGQISTPRALQLLPADIARLSYPLGYWNGVAIFIGLAVPLLLRTAVCSPRPLVRALALAPFPVFAPAVYLASSRGGAATAAVGAVAFVALTPQRMRAFGAVLVAALGSAAGVAALAERSELINHPGPAAAGEGHIAALLVLACCAATAGLYLAALRYLTPRVEGISVGTTTRRLTLAAGAVLVAAGIAASHPIERFDQFKKAPKTVNVLLGSKGALQRHFLSGSSSGRWQQWQTAAHEFESAPWLGGGAGSYEAWWAQHGNLPGYVKNAHSLYLETMGTLGIVGLVLIVGAFLAGLVAGAMRVVRSTGEVRVTLAAVWAAFLAYAFAAGIDWMWQMTVVSVVGIALLALLTARASTDGEGRHLRLRWDLLARGALVLVGLAVMAAQTVSLVTNRELEQSQAASSNGNVPAALGHATNAKRLEPWAASPYLQLALVSEQAGDLSGARDWLRRAISRDRNDWHLWYLSARIETELGDIPAALRSAAEFKRLNPRSGLLALLGL